MKDIDIREPLFDYLDEKYFKNRIIEEKTMGRSRADVIMVLENEVIGFEIKSDADTYERLKRQARDYNKYCDKNYIVIGQSHLKHVEEHIAKSWGILCVTEEDGEIKIEEIRPAGQNNKCKLERQIEWLWRIELCHLLERNHLPKYKAKSKKFVQEKLVEKVPPETLKMQICDELFERDYTTIDEVIKEYKEGN